MRIDSLVRDFYLPCYLAFQMGYYVLAASSHAAVDPHEAARLNAAAARYAAKLRQEPRTQ